MSNTQSKLNRLIDTKTNLRQKLISLGVDVPIDTPFKDYPSLIEQLGGIEITETTTDQDLLQMVDLYHYLGSAQYEDYTYSDEEIANVHNLLDTIIDGEEIVEPELEPTVLLITDIGETRYHEGETFSLDGYTITAVYGDGRRVDVTADCSFTPSVELITEDEYVTISCEIDGTILTVKQAIDVTVAPTFVDYLQSSNTQYINTEFLPNQDTTVEMKIFRTTPRAYWFSAWNTAYNNGAYAVCNDGTNVYSGYDGQGGGTGSPVNDGEHIIKLDKNIVYIDGEVFREFEYTNFQVNYSLYLFAQNRAGTAYFSSTSGENAFIMTECKIYDNGTLVRNFKPCQDGEGTYCLYDTVRKKYYYNQGTGVFEGGNFVEATQLDYINITGTQYIDTGFIPNQDTRIEFSARPTSSLTQKWVYGSRTSSDDGDKYCFYIESAETGAVWYQCYAGEKNDGTTVVTTNINISNSDVTFKTDKNVLYINDTIVDTREASEFDGTYPITLFALNNGGTIDNRMFSGKFYSCQIYDNGTLVRNFIPYMDGLGTYCVKDLVENKYYYNKGTGDFLGGMFLEPEQLDYIESTGTQYIDTGVAITPTVGTELTFTATTKANTVLMGALVLNSARFQPLTISSAGEFNGSTDITGTAAIYGNYDNGIHTLQYNVSNSEIVFDGEVKGTITSIGTSTASIHIFQRNYSDSPMPASFILYACKMYDNGELIRDFVPYKDEFGVICLKDLVENKYYYNKGTGKFLGPIPNNVTVLNYIESTGTQYINTGISAPNGYRAVLKTNITGFTTGYSVLVGSHESSSPYKDNYLRYLNTGVPELGMYNSLKVTNITLRSGIDYTIDSNNVYNKHYLKINGVSATFSGSASSSTKSDKTLGLMGLHTGNNAGSQFTKAKLYYCEIYSDANVILRYFIPCKDDHEVVCMYDRVSDQYFYNQGTGEFLGE